ncbi:MAG: CaiB/BaiF CoA-transferase family protein [Eubacteriales bacterium]|nr:CaiB/BaiF CoA-transferase family protein [Eubacteriales bacterium]MDY3333014.1 CaiB/BaiF CoA-transferase family protein [Gallibacter sp.]
MSKKPLEGVKVVELATFIAAATTGRFFADLGADVIKIESPKGDPLRYTAPTEGRPADKWSLFHENTTWELENGNKRNLSINMKDPAGKEAFFKLLEGADILITNWRVQALERAGLDYETLKTRFPKLVYGIITGYGEYGPDKDLPGFDFTSFFARGGYLETLRQKGTVPYNMGPGLGDHNVGMNLAAGILAALYHASKTGEGEKVQTSLFETAVHNMGMMIQAAQYTDVGVKYPINIREATNPLNAAWETKEGRFIQTCMPDYNVYYNRLMKAIGREDLIDDERYYPVANLHKNNLGTEIYDIVYDAFKTKTVDEWRPLITEVDIAFSLAQNWEEILVDEQAWANDCFYKMTYDNGAERTLVRLPVKFREMGVPEYNRGPQIGEQSVDIMKELGYTEDQIKEFLNNGTIYVGDQ